MATTMSLQRAWTGPALFTYGFRPFFLFGALQAALMVAIWVPWYLGLIRAPSAFPPVVWHTHELLFGYVPAIFAGFLLTAVPNWTGRLPVLGWPLAGLFALWLLGRAVVAGSQWFDPFSVAALSLAFPLALSAVIGREIVAGKNWRNLAVLAGIAVLMLAQGLFHYEIWRYGRSTYGDHLAVAATLVMIMLIGGRIVPSFTINWLKMNNPGPLPTPFNSYDKIAMVVGVLALLAWVAAPLSAALEGAAAALCLLAGALHAIRLGRWQGWRTLREPLVTVLHIAYAFVPLGFLLAAIALWDGQSPVATGATHAWTTGAIGLMTLAVMTRASRGHTGHTLTAPPGTVAIYALIIVAALARLVAALWPEALFPALSLAGLAWVGAFGLFAALYGPMLVKPKGQR
jgi:uncharacterized protein involved in response to NO